MLSWLRREYVLRKHCPGARSRWLLKHRNCEIAQKEFILDSKRYRYFVHPYNWTWNTERAVEIPVVYAAVKGLSSERVLEIGNVLYHYFGLKHPVVDKYEKEVIGLSRNLINEDITAYRPERKFELVVSISTVEHVGCDERPRNPKKILEVFPRIMDALSPGGRAIVTVPVGHNPYLDDSIREQRIRPEHVSCLTRVSESNEWEQVDLKYALSCRYGYPFSCANAVVFMFFNKTT